MNSDSSHTVFHILYMEVDIFRLSDSAYLFKVVLESPESIAEAVSTAVNG